MASAKSRPNMIDLDGRTGEGGGQVVRIALALSAITGIPIRIHHVRGNRMGPKRGGGLKAQHVACVTSLALAANAEVSGGHVGSQILEFIPAWPPKPLGKRDIWINMDSVGSTLLVLQSILPFLLFSADDLGSPITIRVRGGTHVSFSLSFDYLDQVLSPALESMGVTIIERKIGDRGWSQGSKQMGDVKFTIQPLPLGQYLDASKWPVLQAYPIITKIDITIVVPEYLRDNLKNALALKCSLIFPNIQAKVIVNEDSKHRARIYTLLVAHTETGFRFGRDWLYDRKATLPADELAKGIAQKVFEELAAEIRSGRGLDEHLQDQLVIFQALAKGVSSMNGDPKVNASIKPSNSENSDTAGAKMRVVKNTSVPFGDGSMHTKTARWVVSQLLPETKWYDNGNICEGVAWVAKAPES